MANPTDTRALTQDAFWALLAEGRKPTVQAVQDWFVARGLTRRNGNTISSALTEGWQSLGERLKQEQALPGLPDDVAELVLKLRSRMCELAAEGYTEERAALEARMNEVRRAAETQALHRRVAARERRNADHGTDSAAVRSTRTSRNAVRASSIAYDASDARRLS